MPGAFLSEHIVQSAEGPRAHVHDPCSRHSHLLGSLYFLGRPWVLARIEEAPAPTPALGWAMLASGLRTEAAQTPRVCSREQLQEGGQDLSLHLRDQCNLACTVPLTFRDLEFLFS